MNLRFHCTFRHSVRDLQYLMQILAGIVVLIRFLRDLQYLIWIITGIVVLIQVFHVTCST